MFFSLLSLLLLQANAILPPNGIRFSPLPGVVIVSTSDDFGFSRVIAVGEGVTSVQPGEAVFATCDYRFEILGTAFCSTSESRLLLTPSSLEIAAFATTAQACDWDVVPTSNSPPNLWTKVGCNAEVVCLASCPYDPVPTAQQILTSESYVIRASCPVWENCTIENLLTDLPTNTQYRLYCAFRSGNSVSSVRPAGGLFFRTGSSSGPYRFILGGLSLGSLSTGIAGLIPTATFTTSLVGSGAYFYFNRVLTAQEEAAINKYIYETDGVEWGCNSCYPSPCKATDGCSSTGQDTHVCISIGTKTLSPTGSITRTQTNTGTSTELPSRTISRTLTSTRTRTNTFTSSSTPTPTRTGTYTATATPVATQTGTLTVSNTPTVSYTPTTTLTHTLTETPTPTLSFTPTSTVTLSPSRTTTPTVTFTKTNEPVAVVA